MYLTDSNTGLDNGLLDQIEGYEVHDEYIDDEIYNTDDSGNDVPEESDGNSNGDGGPDNEGDNVMDEQLVLYENNEGNGELEQVPPHGHGNREQTTVAVRKQEKDHRYLTFFALSLSHLLCTSLACIVPCRIECTLLILSE